MPVPTPFHPRTAALCTSLFWKEWAGHHAVRSYDTNPDREYFALRHAAGLIDITPLYKYDVSGPDAAEFLAALMVRDVRRLRPGRVAYVCWCDDDGKVVDDGTVSRLGEDRFRVTAAEPALGWFLARAGARRVRVEDVSRSLSALALQGPGSRAILGRVCAPDLGRLRFFRVAEGAIGPARVAVSRTGYTGDLGYEIWVRRDDALTVWDALVEAGRPHRLQPVGLDALDIARIEAGYLMNGVDYFSANQCLIDSRKSTPYELGLGWTVHLDRGPFLGRAALVAARARGPVWSLVGLEYDWDELEALFARHGLPARLPGRAWRDAVPVYDPRGRQVGQATSGTWSPLLKRNIALATVRSSHAEPGTRLRIEATVEYTRNRVTATVVRTPFYDPPAKRG